MKKGLIMILTAVVIVFTSCVKRIEDNFSDTTVLKVNTKDPILTGHTVMTGGDVTKIGSETVTERGICYGTQPYPDITGSHILSGSGTGSYTSTFDIKQNNVTYYIRAYATNANGTNYGEQKTVAKLDLPTFQYNGSTYYVAPDPGILMSNFGEANSYCENYGIYGTTGWRLPTIDELTAMYAKRESIGGFESTTYYSSTKCDSYWYYVLDFSNGRYESDYYYYARVRPIKKIN